jgi:hypothetical protein
MSPGPDEFESAAPTPVEAANLAPVVDWRSRASDWLEHAGKLVGIPSLIVGLVALCLSAIGLSYIVANYRLAVAANRPFLVSNGLKADFDARSADTQVGFINVGKLTGRRRMLILFSLSEPDARPVKLVVVPIVGAGTNVFAGHGATARFDPHLSDNAPFILACAKYFDDTGTTYEQAFLFQRGEIDQATKQLPYSELAQPNQDRCSVAEP